MLKLLLILATLLVAIPGAQAQQSAIEASRRLNAQGLQLLAEDRLAEAESLFQQALALCPQPTPLALLCSSVALNNLADIRRRQGRYADAIAYMRRSLDTARQIVPPSLHTVISRTLALGRMYDAAGRPDQAEAPYRDAVALAERNGAADPGTLGECLGDLAGAMASQGRLAEAVEIGQRGLMLAHLAGANAGVAYTIHASNLGVDFNALGRHAEAEALFRAALSHPMAAGAPANLAARLTERLGATLWNEGRIAEAETLLLRATAWWDAHPDLTPERFEAMNVLGQLYDILGRPADAESWLRKAATLARANLPPGNTSRAASMGDLGVFYLRQARLRAAAELLEPALAELQSVLPPDDRRLVTPLGRLSGLRRGQGRQDEAQALLDRGDAILRAAGLSDSLDAFYLDRERAILALDRRVPGEAARLYSTILERLARISGPDTTTYARDLGQRAEARLAAGEFAAAEADLRQALPRIQAAYGPGAETARLRADLAMALDSQGHADAAEAEFAQAIATDQALAQPARATADLLVRIAKHHAAIGRFAKADALDRQAMALYETTAGHDSWAYVEAQNDHIEMAKELGDFPEAVRASRDSLAIAEKLSDPASVQAAWCHDQLGEALRAQGNYAAAETQMLRAIAIITPFKYDAALAYFVNTLGILHIDTGLYPQAATRFAQAVALDSKSNAGGTDRTATYLTNRASALRRLGDLPAAEADIRRALALRQQQLDPGNPNISDSFNALGLVQGAEGHYAAAEAAHRRALAMRLIRPGPTSAAAAFSLSNLAAVLAQRGHPAEAEPLATRALAIDQARLGPDHPGVAQRMLGLAGILRQQARYAEAAPLVQRAAAILAARLPASSPVVASATDALAETAIDAGDYRRAEALERQALAVEQAALGANARQLGGPLHLLAALALARSDPTEAAALAARALAIGEHMGGPEHPALIATLALLGDSALLAGHTTEAALQYQRARAIAEHALGPPHPDRAIPLLGLAAVARTRGRFAEAGALAEQAVTLRRAAYGSGHPATAAAERILAAISTALGHPDRARGLYQSALTADRATYPAGHPALAPALEALAGSDIAQGRYTEAADLLHQALAIRTAAYGADTEATTPATLLLARLADARGDVAQAMVVRRHALALRETALGPDAPALVGLLAALAGDEARLGRGEDARAAIAHAARLITTAELKDTLAEAEVLAAQGLLDLAAHDNAAAETALLHAQAIRYTVLGRDHPAGLGILNNLGVVYLAQNRPSEARTVLEHALALGEAKLGRDHPELAIVLGNLARLDLLQGRRADALTAAARAASIRRAAGIPDSRADPRL